MDILEFIYDGTTYITLFEGEIYDFIYNRIKYLIGLKSGIKYFVSHNNERIKVEWYNSLSVEATLAFHNAMILIKSVIKRNQSHCYYNIFLEKASYQSPKNNDNK